MSASQARTVRTIAERVASTHHCDLEDVAIRRAGRRRVVRVVVDHAGGLSLDLVADISRDISRALDDADALGDDAYVLEVTSPGVDRPLTLPRHWERAVGRLVEVGLVDGGSLVGRVTQGGQDSVWLDVDGHTRELMLDRVRTAVVQVEFARIEDAELDEDDAHESDEG
jgi:ribosome maturation factor RimP